MRIGIILALLATGSASAADTGSVLECMRANIPQTVRIQALELTVRDRGGVERTLKGRVFGTREKDLVRVMARVEAPADLAGAAYLVRETKSGEEMYLYLPAVNRVKRVTGAAVDGSLWGTDFSYSDFKQVQNAFAGGATTLSGASEIDGRATHIVEFARDAATPGEYDAIRTQVDQKTCVTLRAEFLSKGTVRKRMTVPGGQIKRAGKQWYMSEATMEDLQRGTRTRLRVVGVTEGDAMSARYFNPSQFYLAR